MRHESGEERRESDVENPGRKNGRGKKAERRGGATKADPPAGSGAGGRGGESEETPGASPGRTPGVWRDLVAYAAAAVTPVFGLHVFLGLGPTTVSLVALAACGVLGAYAPGVGMPGSVAGVALGRRGRMLAAAARRYGRDDGRITHTPVFVGAGALAVLPLGLAGLPAGPGDALAPALGFLFAGLLHLAIDDALERHPVRWAFVEGSDAPVEGPGRPPGRVRGGREATGGNRRRRRHPGGNGAKARERGERGRARRQAREQARTGGSGPTGKKKKRPDGRRGKEGTT